MAGNVDTAAFMRAEAHKLAAFGFAVFPCMGKIPATPKGHHDATTTPPPAWWTEPHNIGIALEHSKGPNGKQLFGVDIDPRSNGAWSWAKFIAGRDVPETVRAVTGRGDGGYHFYFWAPAGTRFPKQLASGVDVKAAGYLIAPPSLHPDTNEAYRWESDPWSTAIADAPQWFLDEMAKANSASSATPVAAPLADHFVTGERNNMLASIAGSVRRRGMVAAEILPLLEAVNAQRCRPPLPPHEVQKIAESAERNMDAADPVQPGDSAVTELEWRGVRDIEKPLPDVPYICQGLRLSPGAITLFAGYGYSGKTISAQSLLVSIASGRLVWGAWAADEGPVGHLDYEQGQFLCDERVQRLARGMDVSLSAVAHDRYRLVSLPAQYVDAALYDRLCRAFAGCKAVLVDSFRAACPGVDENSSDARIPLDVLSRVGHALGAAIVVIHHARKTSDDDDKNTDPKMVIRGSSAIFDAAQSAYVLIGREKQPSVVHHVKDRFRGVTLDKFGLQFNDVDGGVKVEHLNTEQLARIDFAPEVEKFDKRTRAILEAVRAGARTSNDVWRRVRGDRNAVLKRVKEMLSERELAFINNELRVV